MIVHPLFPVTVCEFNYPNSAEIKQKISKSIFNHLNEDGFSGEKTGHVTIHNDPEYYDLFCFLQKCVEEYLKTLSVDVNKFDINFIKSWFNILKNNNTPQHSHGDAHISISYYVNTPENYNQAIRFYNYNPRLEPFPGCIRWNNTEQNWNILNAYTWQFVPKEGDVFIFPSDLFHDTIGTSDNTIFDTGLKTSKDFNEHRICLASDVLLTYNNKQAVSLGIQPVQNWRTFK